MKERGGDYVALVINYDADYAAVVEKASKVLGLNPDAEKCLVHTSGSRIIEEQINENGRMRAWCIGRYLQFVYARSTSVRLGILVEDLQEEVYRNTE